MIYQASPLPLSNGSEDKDIFFMQQALSEACKAGEADEVPVGAIIVHHDQIITSAHNEPRKRQDPTAHAEILVLQQAAQILNNYRLINCTLYVTLEPCCMCAGALVHARINRVVYGAYDKKRGCVSSKLHLLDQPFHNHTVNYQGGVCEQEALDLLQNFFKDKRLHHSQKDGNLF